MKDGKAFAVVGGDIRFAYLAGFLAEEGKTVMVNGLDNTELPVGVTGCSDLRQVIALADTVILPMPVSADGITLNAPLSRVRISLKEILDLLRPEQRIMGGKVTPSLLQETEIRGLHITDYLNREELAVKNAVPTAEGAVQLAMEELPCTIRGADCLVTGFGRVAKVIAKLLYAMGARVTVMARKCGDRALAATNGYEVLSMEQIHHLPPYDVIFNTVPAMLFNESVLQTLSPHTLLIDLASRPGGVDFMAAATVPVKTIWALSLPGRVAPKSAAAAIMDTVFNIIEEDASCHRCG